MNEEKSYSFPQVCNFASADVDKYSSMGEGFKKFFEYAKLNDLSAMVPGRYEIDGDNLFFTISEDNLRSESQAPLEAHRKYADIQILIEGLERIGLKNCASCLHVKTPYSDSRDIEFFEDKPDVFLSLRPMQFAVFMPSDAHAPLIGEGRVKKCVVKVRL